MSSFATVFYASFALPGALRPAILKCYFDDESQGCRCHWELRTVQSAMIAGSGCKSKAKWLLDMYHWWYKKLAAVDAHHLLQKASNSSGDRSLPDLPRNGLCEHTAGTKALLHLFMLWASAKDNELSSAAVDLLDSILQRILKESVEIRFSLPAVDGGALVSVSLVAQGHLLVYGGLAAGGTPDSARLASLFIGADPAGSGMAALGDILRRSWMRFSSFAWFYQQLLNVASFLIEDSFAEVGFEQDAFRAGLVLQPRRRADLDASASLALGRLGGGEGRGDAPVNTHAARAVASRLGFCGGRAYQGGEELVMCRYWDSLREHYAHCSSIGLAADASTVGAHNLMMTVLCGRAESGPTRGQRLVGWAPPQELGVHVGGLQLSA